MKNFMLKVLDFIKHTLILSLFFIGTECLLYDLLSRENNLYYPFFILFMLMIGISLVSLNERKKFNIFLSSAVVLGAVFTATGVLAVGVWLTQSGILPLAM